MKIKLILIFSGTASLLALGDRYEISYFYIYLMRSYHLNSLVIFSYIFTAFYFGYTAMQIPGGIIARRFGNSKVIGSGLIVWSFFLFGIFFIHVFLYSVIFSFFMGIFQGPLYPSLMQLLRDNYSDNDYPSATSVITFFGNLSPVFIFLFSLLTMDSFNLPQFTTVILASIGVASGLYFISNHEKNKTPLISGNLIGIIKKPKFWILGISFLSYDAFFYVFLSWYPVIEKIRVGTPRPSFLSYLPWIVMAVTALFFGRIMTKLDRDLSISILSYLILIFSIILILTSSSLLIFLISVSISLSLLNPIIIGFWRVSTRISGSENSSVVGGWMNFWGNMGGLISPVLTAYFIEKFKILGVSIVMLLFVIVGLITRLELGEI